MARKSLEEVSADASVAFPDNTSGEITPLVLRNWIGELLMAIRPAYGYLNRVGPTVQALTTAFAALVFDSATLSPVVDYTLSAPTGKITRNEKGTTRLTFSADISPTANANNLVTFQVFKNGVATPWTVSVMLTATGVTESVSLVGIEYLNGIADYELKVKAGTAGNFNMSNLIFVAETVPVWSYI
jgi:hypothetical protein